MLTYFVPVTHYMCEWMGGGMIAPGSWKIGASHCHRRRCCCHVCACGHTVRVWRESCTPLAHTHTRLTALVQDHSGEPVPEGKTSLDFTEARDSEWQWHQLGYMQGCTSLQTDNHASTPPLSFLQAGCPSCRPTNSVKALKVTFHWHCVLKVEWDETARTECSSPVSELGSRRGRTKMCTTALSKISANFAINNKWPIFNLSPSKRQWSSAVGLLQ